MLRLITAFALALSINLASNGVAACDGCGCGGDQLDAQSAPPQAPVSFDKMPAPGTKAVCLVTGETFTVTKGTLHSEYKGKTYVFCCPACKPQFDKEPEKFIKKKG